MLLNIIKKRTQTGYSLIEVLVALVVLGVGLLGLASLQATSLRNTDAAYRRSQAVYYAYAIIDQMRANRSAALGGNYSIDMDGSKAAQNCMSSACTSTQLAQRDLHQWLANLAEALPSGDGEISTSTVSPSTGGALTRVDVTIQWHERGRDEPVEAKVATIL